MNIAQNADSRLRKVRKLIATVYHQSKYTKVKVTNPQSAVRHIDFVLKSLHIKNLCFNELCNMLIEEDRGSYVELLKILFSIQQMFLKSGLIELYLKVQRDSEKESANDDNKQRASFHRFLVDNTETDLQNNVKAMQTNLLKGMHKGMLTRSFEKLMDQNFNTKGLETRKDDRVYFFNEEKENSNAYHAHNNKNRDQDEQIEKDAVKLMEELENGRYEKAELVKDPLLLLRVNEKIAETVLSTHLKLDKRVDKWIEKLSRIAYDKDNFKEMIETLNGVVDRSSGHGDQMAGEDKALHASRLGGFKIDELERHIQDKFGDGFRLLFRKLLRLMEEARKQNVGEKNLQTELTAMAIEEEYKRAQSDRRKFEDEIMMLRSKIIELENNVDHLQNINSNLESRCSDFSRQLFNVKEEYDKLEKEGVECASECKELKSQVQFLQNDQAKMSASLRAAGKRMIELQASVSNQVYTNRNSEEEARKIEIRVDSADDLKFVNNVIDQLSSFIKGYVYKSTQAAVNVQNAPVAQSQAQSNDSGKLSLKIINRIKTDMINKITLKTLTRDNTKSTPEVKRKSMDLRQKFRAMINNESITLEEFLAQVLQHTNIQEIDMDVDLEAQQGHKEESISNLDVVRQQKLGSISRIADDHTEKIAGQQKNKKPNQAVSVKEQAAIVKAQQSRTGNLQKMTSTGRKNEHVSSNVTEHDIYRTDAASRSVALRGTSKQLPRSKKSMQIGEPKNDVSHAQKNSNSTKRLSSIFNNISGNGNAVLQQMNASEILSGYARDDRSLGGPSKRQSNIRIRKSQRAFTKSISGITDVIREEKFSDENIAEDIGYNPLAEEYITNERIRGDSLKPRSSKVHYRQNPEAAKHKQQQDDTIYDNPADRYYGKSQIPIYYKGKGVAIHTGGVWTVDDKTQIYGQRKQIVELCIENFNIDKPLQKSARPTFEYALQTVMDLPQTQQTQMAYYLKQYFSIGSTLTAPRRSMNKRASKLGQLLPAQTTFDNNSGYEPRSSNIHMPSNINVPEYVDDFSEPRYSKRKYSHNQERRKSKSNERRQNSYDQGSYDRITTIREYSNDEMSDSDCEHQQSDEKMPHRDKDNTKYQKNYSKPRYTAPRQSALKYGNNRKSQGAEIADYDLRKINEIICCGTASAKPLKHIFSDTITRFRPKTDAQVVYGSNFSNFQRSEYHRMNSTAILNTLKEKLKEMVNIKRLSIDPHREELQSKIKRLMKRFSQAHANCGPICKHLLYFEKHVRLFASKQLQRQAMVLPVVKFDQVSFPSRKTFLPLNF